MRATVALLAFVGSSTLLAAASAVVEGSLGPRISLASLVLGVAVAALVFGSSKALPPPVSPGSKAFETCVVFAFAVVALRHFLWLVSERDGAVWTLDPYNYGDLPLHWTYIRYFANGASFWPENPIFTGRRLQYPMGIDLFTALFVQLGVTQATALRLVGLAAAALLVPAMRRWGGGFALAAFLFSGGLGTAVEWKNLFLALFVPQRGLLYAVPSGLVLLWSWRERLLRGGRGLPDWVEGLLWGTLPLFHLHTFVFVSLVYGVWAVAQRAVRRCLATFLWALLPAVWTTWQVTDGFAAAALVWWKPGWTMGRTNALLFLGRNFTLFLPLVLWAGLRALRPPAREARLTIFPGLILFVSLFFVMLAPWDWDNTKMMIWCYLLVLPAVADSVWSLAAWPRAIVLLAAFLPGALTIADSLGPRHHYQVFEVQEKEAVCAAVSRLPVGERVATAQSFSHPIALCGHPIVAGYSGHLWSHGIRARAVEERLRSLMLGEPGWEETARSLQARYLFWGPREEEDFSGSSRPWEVGRIPLAQGSWGRLYVIEQGGAALRPPETPSRSPK